MSVVELKKSKTFFINFNKMSDLLLKKLTCVQAMVATLVVLKVADLARSAYKAYTGGRDCCNDSKCCDTKSKCTPACKCDPCTCDPCTCGTE